MEVKENGTLITLLYLLSENLEQFLDKNGRANWYQGILLP